MNLLIDLQHCFQRSCTAVDIKAIASYWHGKVWDVFSGYIFSYCSSFKADRLSLLYCYCTTALSTLQQRYQNSMCLQCTCHWRWAVAEPLLTISHSPKCPSSNITPSAWREGIKIQLLMRKQIRKSRDGLCPESIQLLTWNSCQVKRKTHKWLDDCQRPSLLSVDLLKLSLHYT